MIKISCKLRALREGKDLTQEDLAEKLGISRQSIISVESGKSFPSLPLALEIANLFEKAIEEIFECGNKMIKNFPDSSIMNRKESRGGPVKYLDYSQNRSLEARKAKMRNLIPFRPLGMDRFFDDDWQEMDFPKVPKIAVPAIDVYEKDKKVVVECQLPGIDPENVKIDVADDVLKISGEKKIESEDKEKNYYHREMSYSSFARSVILPTKVKSDKAEADYSDGILKITIPKIEEKKPKAIKVKVKSKK